jgi:hypothetical protein
VNRRSVVVGLVAVGGSAGLGLAGCGTRGGSLTSSDEAGTDGAGPDDDLRLVATALNAELAAVDALTRTRRRHASLRDVTDEALRIHRTHVRLLRGAGDGGPGGPAEPTRVPGGPTQALRALVRMEGAVSSGHVSTAMAASSGSLARVVAAMSVASAQLEQLLSQEASAGGEA